MPQILLLAASPRPEGTSDVMAHLFAEGADAGGVTCHFRPLRAARIRPCRGCGRCAAAPFRCPLSGDDADALFADIIAADLVFWAAPIYFYGLPAHAKACLDRAQRFWAAPVAPAQRPAIAGLVAGRPRGEQLFTGATLGLRYFFPLLGRTLVEARQWYGMEGPDDWQQQDAGLSRADAVRQWGHHWAQQLLRAAPCA